jgi:hypothetical protein
MTDSESGGGYQPPPPPGGTGQPPGSVPPPYAPPTPDETDSTWGQQAPASTPHPYGAPSAPPYGQPPASTYGSSGYPTPAPLPSGRKRPSNRALSIAGVALVVVVVIVVAGIVAGGGSSGPDPSATVTKFIQAVATNDGAAICPLYLPGPYQSECKKDQANFKGAVGTAQVVSQVVQGDEALVSLTGRVCAPYLAATDDPEQDCEVNSTASSGMPSSTVTFAQAFASATSAEFTGLSPAACEELNGTWYVVP